MPPQSLIASIASKPKRLTRQEEPSGTHAFEVTDDASRYRALLSRDRRFDGTFFVCVRTTGVYCRPVCPAPTPKFRNVVFHRCAAAAEAAGFRPCLRCRPETAPGSAAWLGASSTVLHAFRLIEAGTLDDGDVESLAARLGMGARHLRRLFRAHVGASPAAVAQTRRVQLAKRLLDETTLPIARIAFDAGFLSIRRFNEAMTTTYGRAPRELRRERRRANGAHSTIACTGSSEAKERPLVLRLAYRAPLAWNELLEFFADRTIPGIEEVSASTYRRRMRYGDATGIVVVSDDSDASCVRVALPTSLSCGITSLLGSVRRVFDLDADPTVIAQALAADPVLGLCVRNRPGLRVPGAWDPLEIAVRAIVGQQISVKAATAICGRVVEHFGERVGDERLPFMFPSAQALSGAPLEHAGLTRVKAEAVRAVARAIEAGTLLLDGTEPCERVTEKLQSLPGIGPWTAGYISMRALREPDAFPTGDLGLRRALGDGHEPVSARKLLERSAAWRPWRAYATLHAWFGERDFAAGEVAQKEKPHAPNSRGDRNRTRHRLARQR